jgi:heme oxygenase (mycobilin-producing)
LVFGSPRQARSSHHVRLHVAPSRRRGRLGKLIEAFRNRLGAVDAHDGFLGLEVWRSDRDPGEVIMVSRWRARSCFTAYMKSADHRRSHDRIPADVDAAIRLERLDHLRTYEVVAE